MYSDHSRRELEKRSFTFYLLVDNSLAEDVDVLVRDHTVQTVGPFGKKLVEVRVEKDATYRGVRLSAGLDWYAMDIPLTIMSRGAAVNQETVMVYKEADHLVNVASAACYCFEPRKEYTSDDKSKWKSRLGCPQRRTGLLLSL